MALKLDHLTLMIESLEKNMPYYDALYERYQMVLDLKLHIMHQVLRWQINDYSQTTFKGKLPMRQGKNHSKGN